MKKDTNVKRSDYEISQTKQRPSNAAEYADRISVYIYLTIDKQFTALLYVNSMLIVC